MSKYLPLHKFAFPIMNQYRSEAELVDAFTRLVNKYRAERAVTKHVPSFTRGVVKEELFTEVGINTYSLHVDKPVQFMNLEERPIRMFDKSVRECIIHDVVCVTRLSAYPNSMGIIEAKSVEFEVGGQRYTISNLANMLMSVRSLVKMNSRNRPSTYIDDNQYQNVIFGLKVIINLLFSLLSNDEMQAVISHNNQVMNEQVKRLQEKGCKIITVNVDEIYMVMPDDLNLGKLHGLMDCRFMAENAGRCIFMHEGKYITNIQGQFVGFWKERKSWLPTN